MFPSHMIFQLLKCFEWPIVLRPFADITSMFKKSKVGLLNLESRKDNPKLTVLKI